MLLVLLMRLKLYYMIVEQTNISRKMYNFPLSLIHAYPRFSKVHTKLEWRLIIYYDVQLATCRDKYKVDELTCIFFVIVC